MVMGKVMMSCLERCLGVESVSVMDSMAGMLRGVPCWGWE